jgi:hypothetical protein
MMMTSPMRSGELLKSARLDETWRLTRPDEEVEAVFSLYR